jgi:Ca-activated chloride channel family protein
MKRLLTFLALSFCLLTSLNAQDENNTDCPYFNVFTSDSTGVDFSLIATDVSATISGVIANVVVEQTYYNGGDSVVDATYVFPMSTQAAIYAMEMEIDGRVIKAEIKRKAEAEEIFNEADTSGLTATLLEQERPNVFQMSLANIGPDDSLKVRMVYTELLVPREGVYQFVFPSIVGPRYTVGGEPWVTQTALDSVAVSNTRLDIDLKINGGMALSAEVISHDVTVVETENTVEATLSTSPGSDFIANYTLDKENIHTGMLLYEGEEENFFLSIIQPAKPDVSFVSPNREYIFIMDVSGSMLGEPLETAKTLITDLLSDLGPEDKFNILLFSGTFQDLFPMSRTATTANVDLALALIDGVTGGGGTELIPALERALSMEVDDDYSRIFTILTDGYVTVEKEAYELIRNNLDEANFFSFGIGRSVNRFIIEGIAYVGEGEPFIISEGVNPSDIADDFRRYIERPAMNNISVSFEGIEVYDVEPFRVPDVFAERPIIVYGKYAGAPQGNLVLTGDLGDGTFSSTQQFADFTEGMEENVALKYLWARKRIRLMSDYGIASNETDTISIEEEITRLGLQYSLITDFTSFVAVDSNAVTYTGSGADPDDGGGTVDASYLVVGETTVKNYLLLRGTVIGSDRQLRLEVVGSDLSAAEEISLRIMGPDGRLLITHRLEARDLRDEVVVELGPVPAGIYFVSLFANGAVLDTEKFVMR